MKKRIFSILTALCLCLTLLPTAALADGETVVEVDNETKLIAALEDSTVESIKLMGDVTISESLTINRTVTLDLNDHVLTLAGEDQFFTVSGQGTNMTLTDSAETKTERKFSINQDGAWVPDENGDETVSGGVITGGQIHIDAISATFTVTDITINASVKNEGGTIAGNGTFNGTVKNEDTIAGGTFYGTVVNQMGKNTAAHIIKDGTFYGEVINGKAWPSEREWGTITGGTFYNKVTNERLGKIIGGVFYGNVINNKEDGQSYPGTISGGTFYGSLENNSSIEGCTVTYLYPTYDETYAIQIVQKGGKAIPPADPDRSDLSFGGWYTYEDAVYDFTTVVMEDMTLYGLFPDTIYGIRIIDKGGKDVYITSKNANDVLGDSTVSYTPGYWNKAEIPSEYWNDVQTALTKEAQEKLLAGEEIPGIRFPKLTLNGAELQEIEADAPRNITIDNWLLVELKGENRVSYSGTQFAIDWNEQGVLVTGDGSLTVDAPNARTAIHYGEGGAYVQLGGTMALNAKKYGFSYGEPMLCRFLGGRLTIQAGTEEDKISGALYGLDDLFTEGNIPDSATFLLGYSAENFIRLAPPYTWENLSQQLEAAAEVGTITHEYYLSLTANYTVTFDTDGGSAVDSQTVPYGGKASAPDTPVKSGFRFVGWYDGDAKWNFDTVVTDNLTLTAKWERTHTSTPSAPRYDIAAESGAHGSVTVSLKSASKGSIVTVAVTPDKGYALETLTVTDKNGSTLDLTDKGGGQYTFTMPSGPVTVTAMFMDDNTMLNFFVDVPADAYYYDAVLWAAEGGIVTGTDEVHFSPDASCTRAQLVTFLWRAAGSPVVNYAMNFNDVDGGAYYAEAVRWAASLGIAGGYGDGRFGTNDFVTREQVAAMLYRFAKAQGMDTTQGGMAAREFADFESVSPYALEAVDWAVNAGVLKGDNNRLLPQDNCTRAQIVTMLYRALGEK